MSNTEIRNAKELKQPYLGELCKAEGYTVYIVDGMYIRDNMDIEFTNFGHHISYDFIPSDELWIDKEYGIGGEEKYFIERMLCELKLLSDGLKQYYASKKAKTSEAKLRNEFEEVLLHINKKKQNFTIVKKVHKCFLEEYSNDQLKIWIVFGKMVRDIFFIDFTEGGHGLVYKFVPKDEIWIDDDLNKEEIPFVLLHEVFERNLMLQGYCYDPKETRKDVINITKNTTVFESAHNKASEIECYYRQNPDKIQEKLKEELNKAKLLSETKKSE